MSFFSVTFAAEMKQVRPKKNLGQHFLTDLSIARRIADTVDACPDIPVLEVGPGMGVMTQFLVEKPRPLKVVEIDRESVAYLKGTLFRENEGTDLRGYEGTDLRGNEGMEVRGNEGTDVRGHDGTEVRGHDGTDVRGNEGMEVQEDKDSPIIEGDFLRMDLHEVFDGRQFVLTGNYPYDISSQIFFKMLDNRDLIPCCTGMIQHEVAVRMASKPGNKQYGILSVLIQAWYDVEYLFTVPPSVFNPPPKVQSAVIRMTRNKVQHLGCDESLFKRVVKTTFNQRRKMLRVSLRQLLPADSPFFTPLPTGDCSPVTFNSSLLTCRPEQLSISEFVELTNMVEKALCASTSS